MSSALKFLFLALSLSALLSTGCNSESLPPVDHPDQLISDCAVLQTADSKSSLDRANWPDTIARLNPVSVQRGPDYIMITTSAETGVGARGYIVSKDPAVTILSYQITETDHPGLFRFDYRP